jgi:2-oxoglutarate/2-oxoacid ferredoxin oxidoreductase subunit alpha
MTEAFSLVGMTETPVVAYLGQRPGPATGLPTRTSQGDLFLALRSSHGEFPRIVMAPHTPEEAFLCAGRAFNLAEKYQTLVVVLFDEYLATSVRSADVEHFMLGRIPIERGKLLSAEELDRLDGYRRFAITEDGISPRALPGSGPKAAYPTTGDEHDEEGHITEDAGISAAMLEKRLRKEEVARADMRAPYRYGPKPADVTFVGWGSTYGAIHEAVDLLNAGGTSANMVHFVDLWPFPREHARKALAGARRLVDVEGNGRAQFAYLLHAETGIQVNQAIRKYDGRGFTPDYILGRLEVK